MAKRQLKIRKMTVTNRRRAQSILHNPIIDPVQFISGDATSPKPMLAEVVEINAHQRA